MVTRSVARLTLALLLCGIATTARATGQYIQEIRFFSLSGMDPDNNLLYFHGRLGILRPTFDDNRLFAAYRQMMGGSFTDAQAQQLLAPCCEAPGANDDTTTWSDARKRVLGPAAPLNDTASRERPPEIAALDVSCFPNAYRNAAATLLERIKQHGATDPSVRAWTTGEDAVLANCVMESALPPDVPDAPAWLKADRAYQIATAYFYRFDYARAAELYAAIGQDAGSPWHKLARYLVARAAVHAAIVAKTPESIAAASAAVAGIAADPELADYRADAPRLASMLAFRTQPQQRAQELAKSLLAADLPASLAADLRDLRDLERFGMRYTDVGAWIYDIDSLNAEMGRHTDAKTDVLARWHDGHALPWLVAAMMFLEPNDPDAAEAVATSQAIDAGSPAYYTLAWNRLRLLIGQGKTDDARAELDRQLAAPALPEGVDNHMRYQRLALARDLGEFVKFAVRRGEFLMYLYDPRTKLDATPLPLPLTKWDSYTATVLSWRTELLQRNPPFFDADAAYGMSSFMPLPMMAQVVLAPGLPANIKRDIGLAVWTRAVLLDDTDTAKSMADAVAPFFPQHADSWKSYRTATTAETKKVEAALLLLKLPAARPYPDYGLGYIYKRDVIGRFGPRWWTSGDKPFDNTDDNGNPRLCVCALPMPLIAPPFITAKDTLSAKADNDRLGKLPGAPAWLGSVVIPWAKAHLSDPRVPEALHNVVRATQYGDMDSDSPRPPITCCTAAFRRIPGPPRRRIGSDAAWHKSRRAEGPCAQWPWMPRAVQGLSIVRECSSEMVAACRDPSSVIE
jgi:hypothetical protein